MPFIKLNYQQVTALISLLESEQNAHTENPTEYDGLSTIETSALSTLVLMKEAMETVYQTRIALRRGVWSQANPEQESARFDSMGVRK
jgi:hypothetical protein